MCGLVELSKRGGSAVLVFCGCFFFSGGFFKKERKKGEETCIDYVSVSTLAGHVTVMHVQLG